MCISLMGDGVFMVAMAWQVYALSNAPAALSMVGIAMTIPTIAFLLLGGVLSDRLDRRRLMLFADLARGVAVGIMALLALTGMLELWHIVVLVAVYGAGGAFFGPAFDAITPEVLPADELAQANALDHLVRPIALRLVGPAVGGVLIAVAGTGVAFTLDALSFLASAAAVLAMAKRPKHVTPTGSFTGDLRTGMGYVRRHTWLWATFAAAAITYLLFMGPAEVLLPYVVKTTWRLRGGPRGRLRRRQHRLGRHRGPHGPARAAAARHHLHVRDLDARHAGDRRLRPGVLGVAAHARQPPVQRAGDGGDDRVATAKQRHVPTALLGRVSSLDWLISIGLLPVSFALTGPVSDAIGVRATLVGAAVVGGIITFGALLLPGMRVKEAPPREHELIATVPLTA